VRSIVLLILLAFAPAAWCQAAGETAHAAVDLIADCSQSVKEDRVGLTDLESACPGLTRALEEAGYLPLLSTAERDALDVYGLSDLMAVDDWYGQKEARDIDPRTLGPILASLRAEEPERSPGLLERFRRWLRSLYDRRQQADPDNWLSRWLEELDLPDKIVRTILLVAIALLFVMAIGVVYNELRVSGLLRQRPVVQDDALNADAGSASGDATDIDALSADRRASMLLRMLVATLVRSGRLRTERGLTYRELSARATFDDAQQRESFRRVASLAERTVYCGRNLTDEEVEPVLAIARALDAQLRGAPA
jgi:hypothetical protein